MAAAEGPRARRANEVRSLAQAAMWKIGQDIGDKEGRMDACVAAAGILKSHTDCLEYPASQFREVRLFLRKGDQ